MARNLLLTMPNYQVSTQLTPWEQGNEQSVCLCRALLKLCSSMWHYFYMVLWILYSLTERLLSTTLKNIQGHSRGGCLAMGEELSWKQHHFLQTPSAVLEHMLRALLDSQVFGRTRSCSSVIYGGELARPHLF